MNCPHCYAETFRHSKPIEIEVLRNALDELYSLGVYHYVLQGGEPLQDPNRLESIISALYPDETYINVVTNGWDMSLENIRWLKELSVDKIAFSLDSGIGAEHDANRKQGSFKRVIDSIDNVLAEGLVASISTVVTHDSLYSEGFKRAYEYAKKKQIRMDVQISEPVGKWDGKTEYLMTPEDSRYIKNLQLASPILPNGQRMINRDIFSGDIDHCPAGTEFMGITVDGQFLPCNFLQFSLGNIKDYSISSMRNALLKNPWFDGCHENCICGENPAFIEEYIIPYIDDSKPLNGNKIFNLNLEGKERD
jgi:MoaA/NifB/PqqE/SkfB family radical SAM enzyme